MRIDTSEIYFVNIYNANRAYGGPEEGGWYYDCGVPVEEQELLNKQAAFTSWDEAWDHAESIRPAVDELNRAYGNYPPHSVRCNGYFTVVVESHPAMAYPSEPPYYL